MGVIRAFGPQSGGVQVVDFATPFIKKMAQESPNYIRRAVKSTGYMMRQEIKQGIKAQAPGGIDYTPMSEITRERILDKIKGRKGQKVRRLRAKKNLLGRLYSATIYRYYSDSNRALIGWLSKSAERLGTKHELGSETTVTEKMRGFFRAAGLRIYRSKQVIKNPKRPTIGPEYQENAPRIPKYIEGKLWSYIENGGKR